jgi:hypothetical protein
MGTAASRAKPLCMSTRLSGEVASDSSANRTIHVECEASPQDRSDQGVWPAFLVSPSHTNRVSYPYLCQDTVLPESATPENGYHMVGHKRLGVDSWGGAPERGFGQSYSKMEDGGRANAEAVDDKRIRTSCTVL